MTEYLRTDHWMDAVFSLESATDFSRRVEADAAWWKWSVIAVHAAVQGFMVLALDRGNAIDVMKPAIAAKWLNAYSTGAKYPDERMDFFLELFAKVKPPDGPSYIGSGPFVSRDSIDDSMKRLNDFRNDFVHFMPKSWSIELAGLPVIAKECVEVAEFLAWQSGQILWHDEALAERARIAFDTLRAELDRLELVYALEKS